jgi:uncharacterized protein YndB with AHSA1/START domain
MKNTPLLTSAISVLPVRDFSEALTWYAQWLRRPPDLQPAEDVAEWQIADAAWIQVTLDAQAAGQTTVVIGVSDIEAQRLECQAAGITLGEIHDYGFIKTAESTDPAGNAIVFVQEVHDSPNVDATVVDQPRVDVQMLIRKTATTVYEAFSSPDQIQRFWLAYASGPVHSGARVTWTFKIAGAETKVEVLEAEPGRLITFRWDDGQSVRIDFQARGDATLVRIRQTDFGGDTPIGDAINAVAGFTLVLASLKSWLERGVEGDLMYDQLPDAQYSDR